MLQLGVIVEGVETMQDLLRPVVEEYAERLAAEPEIAAMLDQAGKYRERTTGVKRLSRRGASQRKARRQR